MRRLHASAVASALVLAGAGCAGDAVDSYGVDAGGAKMDEVGDDHPSGCAVTCDADETLLIASAEQPGQLAIQRIGPEPAQIEVRVTTEGRLADGTSKGGRFFALYSDGVLAAIDGRSGEVKSEVSVDLEEPFAVEVLSPEEAFVSSRDSSETWRVDVDTGDVLAAIDLAPAGVTDLGARHMLIVGDELFALASRGTFVEPAGTHLAVVDLETNEVTRRADLAWQDPDTGEVLAALNPDLPLVLDEPRARLFVGAVGKRPTNTGMTLKVDLNSLEVDSDAEDLSSAFNGHRVISQRFDRVIALEHTSTPVTSTHVRSIAFGSDGRLTETTAGTILDLFEETNDLAINEDGTLAILANHCPVGFCTEGKGVNVIDVGDATTLPKLTADAIGFAPNSAIFLWD